MIFASIHFVSMRYGEHTYVFVGEISCRPCSFPTKITNILPHNYYPLYDMHSIHDNVVFN